MLAMMRRVQGGTVAVASAATPLCAGSRIPDRKELALRGEVSAVLRERRPPRAPGAQSSLLREGVALQNRSRGEAGWVPRSARGPSWLIKGEVRQEFHSLSLAISEHPVASGMQACPRCPVRAGAYKEKGQNPAG